MYKKILAICLSAIIVISIALSPVFADSYNFILNRHDDDDDQDRIEDILKMFLDSDDLKWAEKAIEKMGAMGILNGMGNGYFKPKNNVTHAEALAMVLKLTGQQEEAEEITREPKYFRGASDPWSYGYLQLAIDQGIFIPEEDGRINPKAPAKRHEIAKYVVRALGMRDEALENMDAKLYFKDSSTIPEKSVGYVYVITTLGIMQGSSSLFQPMKAITRAEMAVLLDRAEDKFDDNIPSPSEFKGIFLSYDKNNSRITMEINNRKVVYNVIPNVPVYKDNTYYTLNVLDRGDVIEIVLDNSNRIIFIELVDEGTAPIPDIEELSFRHMEYNSLSDELQDLIDTLKLTENYAAYKQGNYIYLITARGRMPYGGYSINVDEVYKETTANGKYNLRAVVEMKSPSTAITTQVITYPYDVVRLSYFSGIEKVNFVDTDDDLLSQTTITSLDNYDVITGIISSVNTTNRILYIKDSNNIARVYYVPSNAQITLNNKTASLSDLEKNMPVSVTIQNDYAIKIAAMSADEIETINGKISSVDSVNRILYLKESDNITRAYYIPSNVQITLDNKTVSLSSLTENMAAAITRTNDVITKVAAQSITDTEIINGKISSIDATDRIIYLKESDNVIRAYYIPTSVLITLNNKTVKLSALQVNMTAAITRVNGIITKLSATQSIQTIGGTIDSVDAANRTVKLLESNNLVNLYTIPDNAQITLNNLAVNLSELTKGMKAEITKVDGEITKLSAQNDVQLIEGLLINVYPSENNSTINVKVGTTYKLYVITSETEIFYNNQSINIESMPLNTTITIKIINGTVTEVRNK